MAYVYASRVDKNGNKLTTSYGNKQQAKKYGGDSAKLWEGLRYFDRTNGKFNDDAGDIVRSRMTSTVGHRNFGKFMLFSVVNEEVVDLGLRFETYGAANTTMKALINTYPELLVLEAAYSEDEGYDEEGGYSDEAPF